MASIIDRLSGIGQHQLRGEPGGVLLPDLQRTQCRTVNLASDLAALGETSQARALGEDSLARLTRLLGEQHPVTLGCAANLMLDLRADGAAEEADALLAGTMSGYEQTFGLDHPLTEAAAAGTRINWDFDPPPI